MQFLMHANLFMHELLVSHDALNTCYFDHIMILCRRSSDCKEREDGCHS